jgi:hypothetical protein
VASDAADRREQQNRERETIAIVGVGMCVLALAFGPARGLRVASVAPATPA